MDLDMENKENINKVEWLIGAHVGFAGNIHNVIKESIKYGMYTTQFFLGNPHSFSRHKVTKEDIEQSNKTLKHFPLHVFSHFPYIINLAGSTKSLAWNGNKEQDDKTMTVINSLQYELDVLSQLDSVTNGVVIHPGSFKDREQGIKAISQSINKINFSEGSKLLLENCAGEGTKIPRNLQEIKQIIEGIDKDKRKHIGVCIDTAHIWGVGDYDLRKCEEVKRLFDDFDTIIGRKYFSLLHLNDSKVPIKSRKDRHANITTGYIWEKDITSLLLLLTVCTKRKIPIVLETCKEDMFTIGELNNIV